MQKGLHTSGRYISWLLLIIFTWGTCGFVYGQNPNMLNSCSLQDFAPAAPASSVSPGGFGFWLNGIPGDQTPQYSWLGSPSLTFFDDSTALISGQAVNQLDNARLWDVEIWLTNGVDFHTWDALGRDAKVEWAPQAQVEANKQDWLFFEVDSIRSLLTGSAGGAFDGDTLFVSHNPPSRQYGFQYGLAANAKNGDFGISGWFLFSGSYTGHGDVNASLQCAQTCDLDLLAALPQCINDQSFEVEISFSGNGTDYSLTDNQGNALSGLSAGTYIMGPYSVLDTISFTVKDEGLLICEETTSGICAFCDTPQLIGTCPLSDFSPSAQGHAVYLDDAVIPLLNDPKHIWVNNSGLLSFYADTTARITGRVVNVSDPTLLWDVDIWLIDAADYTTWTALGRDVKVESAPQALVDANKQDWLFFEVDSLRSTIIGVAGTPLDGDTLRLSHNPPSRQFGFQYGVAANAKTGDFGISGWFLFSGDYQGAGDVNANAECDPADCDLQLGTPTVTCLNNASYEIGLSFSGTGAAYEVRDLLGNVLDTLAAGSYTFGPFPSNQPVQVLVRDLDNINCADTTAVLVADCSPLCDVDITNAVASCINNQAYEISLSFSGTGSQFEVSVLGGMKLDTLSAGTHVFGPFASSQPVQLVVSDLSNVDCADTTAVLVADCSPLCDVDITNAVASCIDNISYQVSLSFTGTGSQFEVSVLGGMKLDTLSAGTHVFGPFASNQPVQLVVKDLANIDCADTSATLLADCSVLCDVAIDTFYAACFPNISITSFKAFVLISGTTGPYRTQVIDVAGQVLKDTTLAAGLHDLGFYANSTLLQVAVEDPDDITCSAVSPFVTADCTPVVDCDSLQLDMVTATCISNDSFEVVVSFRGQVNQPYRIQALQNSTAATVTLNNLSPGTYSLGNFVTDYAVNVFVAAENQITCVKMAPPVVQNCSGAFPPPNDLCSNAQALSCGQSVQGNFDGASNTGVPSGSCGGVSPRGVGVWYSFQGDGRIITLSTCNTVPAFNTQIFVYSGACGNLTCEEGNDDGTGCFAGTSELTFISNPGVTYYIYVTDASLNGGDFTLDISCTRGFIFNLNLSGLIRNGYSNQLSWNMVESSDLLGYEIERKEYDGEYETIDFVPAKGGVNRSMNYVHEDAQIEEWKVYTYRVRAVFSQNADVMSGERKLLVEQLGLVMLGDLYPNPAEGQVNLPVNSIREQPSEWQLYDMQGRLLSSEEVPLVEGKQTLHINLRGLPQGAYRVLFLAPETLIVKTLLVE